MQMSAMKDFLSNCRVQLIFYNNDTKYKKLIGVTTCNIVGMQYW